MQKFAYAGVVAASLAVGGMASAPFQAPPSLPPGFAATICHATPPRLSHAWADGIEAVPAGRVVRVAAGDISTADHSTVDHSTADHAELLLKLGLLQGHLMVGRELIAAQQPGLALPHFGHPVRELYDDIRPALASRGMTGFDGELVALEALAAGSPGSPAMEAQYDKVMRIVGALRATVPSGLLDNERFMLGVLGEVATSASEDYGESIEGGRIAKPVEYHDSHGYLLYADLEMRRLEARPGLRGSARLAAARAKLGEMQEIVGALLPPVRPVASEAGYKAIVAQFKRVGGMQEPG